VATTCKDAGCCRGVSEGDPAKVEGGKAPGNVAATVETARVLGIPIEHLVHSVSGDAAA
jgi:hypothetical protein